MGSKLTIDEHVSDIEEILQTDPNQFSHLKRDRNLPEKVTQHLRLWRFFEENKKPGSIRTTPISLTDIPGNGFNFIPKDCYVALFVYKKDADDASSSTGFSQSILSLFDSHTNLTPRGLETPVASSRSVSSITKDIFGSFLLPKRTAQEESSFEYMLFVWNGKDASGLTKALTLSKALELDSYISKDKNGILQALSFGASVRNKKVAYEKVTQFGALLHDDASHHLDENYSSMSESIYLLKFLFPILDNQSFRSSGFKKLFVKPNHEPKGDLEEDEFMNVDWGDYEDEYAEDDRRQGEDYSGLSPVSFVRGQSEFDESPMDSGIRGGAGFHPNIPALTLPMGTLGSHNQAQGHKPSVPAINIKGGPKIVNEPGSSSGREMFEDESRSERTLSSQRNQPRPLPQPQQRPNVTMNLPIGDLHKKSQPATTQEPKEMTYEELKKMIEGQKESIQKKLKNEYFAKQCSEVIENFLYVSGQPIAHNEKKLAEYGITHIINAAGDVCENKFPDKIKYLTYYLKDSKQENIECMFYESIDFMEDALKNKGKVLVHCVQGVSRSVTLCIAYLIYKHKHTYNSAYHLVRSIRDIASPNAAFWVQLHNFHLRLYGDFEAIPGPRVFCVGSFQKETPQTIVARLLSTEDSPYHPKGKKLIDTRAVYILYSQTQMYIWVGKDILPSNKEKYLKKAEEYVKMLQKYERAPTNCKIVQCGQEPEEFWKLWESLPEARYGAHKEWDHWFVDLATHKDVVGTTIQEEQDEEEEEEENIVAKAETYCFPNLDPERIADLDLLIDDNFLIVCVEKGESKTVYVWRGNNVPDDLDDEGYVNAILSNKWPDADPEDITFIQEVPDQESTTFINYFN